MGRAMRP
ncbi:unnamed protein product [Timema podura]|nr:unnamed protein product [Timema podura]